LRSTSKWRQGKTGCVFAETIEITSTGARRIHAFPTESSAWRAERRRGAHLFSAMRRPFSTAHLPRPSVTEHPDAYAIFVNRAVGIEFQDSTSNPGSLKRL